MIKFGRDLTNGVIIGDYTVTGKLFYEDREQSQNLIGSSEKEVLEKAQEQKDKWKSQMGEAFDWIYPNKDAWTVKFYA